MSTPDFITYNDLEIPVKPLSALSESGDWLTYNAIPDYDIWRNCDTGELVAVRWTRI